MKPKIIFLLASISQPRCIKRIKSFIDAGYNVEIYGINREKYNNNAIIKGKSINIIATQKDGINYIEKFKEIRNAVNEITKKEGNDNTIYYSFSIIFSFFLLINRTINYIYEISDILYGYDKFRFIRPLIKFIDRLIIKKSLLTIFTSGGFSEYLLNEKEKHNTIIQPNRLDVSFQNIIRPNYNSINLNQLTFSFIGAFRYPNTIFRFAEIIGKKYPNHKFHFYGDSNLTMDVIKLSKKYENVYYYGAFKNPDDLKSIYEKIDVVVAAYDTSGLNERIAEPNKLYESLFFRKPIIVSKGTYLENQVIKYDCGYSINASEDNEIINFIDSLSSNRLIQIQKSIDKIELHKIIDDNASAIIKYIKQCKL